MKNILKSLILRKSNFNTASKAKERLQIIISHQRSDEGINTSNLNNLINQIQEEIIKVVARYIEIGPEQVKINLDKVGDMSVLELNVALPEHIQPTKMEQQSNNILLNTKEKETTNSKVEFIEKLTTNIIDKID